MSSSKLPQNVDEALELAGAGYSGAYGLGYDDPDHAHQVGAELLAVEVERLRGVLRIVAARSCESCVSRGRGFNAGGRYWKCMEHSIPCEELGNLCGKWECKA